MFKKQHFETVLDNAVRIVSWKWRWYVPAIYSWAPMWCHGVSLEDHNLWEIPSPPLPSHTPFINDSKLHLRECEVSFLIYRFTVEAMTCKEKFVLWLKFRAPCCQCGSPCQCLL
jgi:hypothetical protein